MKRRLAGFLAVLAVAGCGNENRDPTDVNELLALEDVVTGLSDPTHLTAPPGDARLFVTEQPGRIRIVRDDALVGTPFLDVTSLVSSGGERGLLSVAFHPDYASNGYFYVNYTDNAGDTRVERYTVSADPDVADGGSAKLILSVEQPFANHNGGQIAFGPDGMLYIGMGDGGSGGDPEEHGQNTGTLLGALLRIDVDGGDPYAIPPDNPFAGDPDAREEIWAFGLRNPWRFSFDPSSNLLFIADVGQNAWEEVSFEPFINSSSGGGRNYGWRRMEASQCFNPGTVCNDGSLVLPILEYSHSLGCSITGGYRYRGAGMPEHFGTYFFGDFCSGRIWGGIENAETGAWASTELLDSELLISTFGEDEQGELYVADLNGRLYRIHGETFCSAGAETIEIANFSDGSVAVEIEIRGEVSRVALGSIVLAASSSMDAGPVALSSGDYALSCRFVDPATGELRAEDLSRFKVE